MIILQDGSNSTVTNIFKVALLPQEIFSKALEICQLYEDGELAPPLTSKQRMRKYISPSSFNFLKGLDPLKDEDQLKIELSSSFSSALSAALTSSGCILFSSICCLLMLDIKIVIITISHRYEDIFYRKIVVHLALTTHFSVQFARSFACVTWRGKRRKARSLLETSSSCSKTGQVF